MTVEITVTRDLPIEPQIFLAAQALLNGEVVVFPTETVYGIGADAINDDALENLMSMKRRSDDKPLPVMVSGLEMAESFVEIGAARQLAKDFWPGPLTLILPSKAIFSSFCMRDNMVGIRCPNHPVAQAIVKIAGIPLALTSANISGQPPATTATEARRQFRDMDLAFRILQSEPTQGKPSTVVKIEPDKWTILRQGPVSADTIRGYLPAGVALAES